MRSRIASRTSRSSPATRTLISSCAARLRSTSASTPGVRPGVADEHDRVERVGAGAFSVLRSAGVRDCGMMARRSGERDGGSGADASGRVAGGGRA